MLSQKTTLQNCAKPNQKYSKKKTNKNKVKINKNPKKIQ